MKRLLLAAIVAMAASGPAWAQSSTATGTGVGIARIDIEFPGDLGAGRHGDSRRSPATAPFRPIRRSRTCRALFSPGLAAAGLETCLGSVSAGGAFVGTGFSFGTTIPDPGCAARLDARTLWSMGLKKAAVARLCLNGDIYRAMPEVCDKYLPQRAPGILSRGRSPLAWRRRKPPRSSPTPAATFGWSKARPERTVFARTTM